MLTVIVRDRRKGESASKILNGFIGTNAYEVFTAGNLPVGAEGHVLFVTWKLRHSDTELVKKHAKPGVKYWYAKCNKPAFAGVLANVRKDCVRAWLDGKGAADLKDRPCSAVWVDIGMRYPEAEMSLEEFHELGALFPALATNLRWPRPSGKGRPKEDTLVKKRSILDKYKPIQKEVEALKSGGLTWQKVYDQVAAQYDWIASYMQLKNCMLQLRRLEHSPEERDRRKLFPHLVDDIVALRQKDAAWPEIHAAMVEEYGEGVGSSSSSLKSWAFRQPEIRALMGTEPKKDKKEPVGDKELWSFLESMQSDIDGLRSLAQAEQGRRETQVADVGDRIARLETARADHHNPDHHNQLLEHKETLQSLHEGLGALREHVDALAQEWAKNVSDTAEIKSRPVPAPDEALLKLIRVCQTSVLDDGVPPEAAFTIIANFAEERRA